MRFVADQMVPDELVDFLRARSHHVMLVRDVLHPRASDLQISQLAHRESAIVVTWNIRHFRRYICRAPRGEHIRFRQAGLLGFACPEPHSVRRARAVFDLVEHEHERGLRLPDTRLFATVQSDELHIER